MAVADNAGVASSAQLTASARQAGRPNAGTTNAGTTNADRVAAGKLAAGKLTATMADEDIDFVRIITLI